MTQDLRVKLHRSGGLTRHEWVGLLKRVASRPALPPGRMWVVIAYDVIDGDLFVSSQIVERDPRPRRLVARPIPGKVI
jgi:hypothetical protein